MANDTIKIRQYDQNGNKETVEISKNIYYKISIDYIEDDDILSRFCCDCFCTKLWQYLMLFSLATIAIMLPPILHPGIINLNTTILLPNFLHLENSCKTSFPYISGSMVIQRRCNGAVNFYRSWDNYSNGFGDQNGEFWIGNEYLHQLTQNDRYYLRIDLEDFESNKVWAEYDSFKIESMADSYTIRLGTFSGTAGDSLSYQNNMKFSTFDRDNDLYGPNCADLFKGAWWYKDCHQSNLNGQYLSGVHASYADGVNWETFKGYYYSLKCTEMKILLK